MVLSDEERLEFLIQHVLHSSQGDVIHELGQSLDIVHRDITIDCTTITNHCVCAENIEYFRKADHVTQCIRKRKCFHCQRYRCMDRKFETVTASTNLLLIAAALGKFDVFKYLHTCGGCLESQSTIFKLRPLHVAIVHGHFNIFCYLLTQQVDVNATSLSHGTTFSPLMMAVKYNQEEMVRHLLKVPQINLAYRNSRLQSPVLFAVQNNHIELVNLLLSAEETANANRLQGRRRQLTMSYHPCVILEAIKQDNISVLKILLESGCKADFVFHGYHWQTTAVILAAILNSHQCLDLLVDYGADTEVDFGGTALQWAVYLDWTESINILHNAQFKHILAGLEANDNDVPREITDENADDTTQANDVVSDVDNLHKSSPLLSIWRYVQWLDIDRPIRRLISKNHDVNMQDRYGRTCLHLAVEEQSVSAVRTLLQLGADTSIRDMCSATPFWHAVYWNKESMIKELMFANVPLECKAREDACRIGLPGMDINGNASREYNYHTTLAIAAKRNFLSTCRLLLEAGYDVSADNMVELMSTVKPATRALLLAHASQPASLFNLTRNFVRNRCGSNIRSLVETVELPFRVRDCLLLRDLFDLKIEPTFCKTDGVFRSSATGTQQLLVP